MKTIVGIFAHPDDEALGPSGTLALLAKENDVYLLCVTNGDALKEGKPDAKLAEIRKKEVEASANVLGIKKVFFLGFHDGTLCNNMYHEIAKKIQEHLEELRPETVITLEMKGLSGHIDHIAVAMITSYLFQKLSFLHEIWYHCITEELSEKLGQYLRQYFIYFPRGYKKSEIDTVIDVSSVWEQKVQAMQQHQSQITDVKNVLQGLSQIPKEENFLVHKK